MSRKIAAAFLGLVFALALAEGFLAVYARHHAVPPPVETAGHPFTILCLGNSYTKGDGAEAGYSYGEILERMLREKRPDLKVRVINGGVSLGTTTLLLERLPGQLKNFRPNVVTLMTGDPNFVFTYGFANFEGKRGVFARGLDALFSLRVFRWARFLAGGFYGQSYRDFNALQWLAFLEDVSYNPLWFDHERAQLAYGTMERYFSLHPQDKYMAMALMQLSGMMRNGQFDHWYEVVDKLNPNEFLFIHYLHAEELLHDRRTPPERKPYLIHAMEKMRKNYPGDKAYREMVASQLFGHAQEKPYLPPGLSPKGRCDYVEKMLPFNPLNVRHYETLAYCLEGIGEEAHAAEVMIQAAERNPYSQHNPVEFLLIMKFKSKNQAVIARIGAFVESFFREHPELKYQGYIRSSPERAAWVRHDVGELVREVRAAGVPVVLQSYPPLRDGFVRVVDRLLPELAKENEVPFSDVNSALRARFTSPAEKESFYSNEFGPQDHHLNAAGNRVVAETLLGTLEQARLLPPGKLP